MKIKIDSFSPWHKQVYQNKTSRWKVSSLIAKSQDLETKIMPLEHLNLIALQPKIETMRDWVGHIKSVFKAELKYPIILGEDGEVMDGRHRIAKALYEGKKTIKFVRFEETPYPDFFEDED